ncbi:hypothetical protein F0562_015765 [Nyssa sinensis]|uniref:Choline transporter-like protein n=1 Tax=Nyssa sinensis TaxID=561372 RepID=A0A5J4ZLE7_9ASTE|nr:hypothetical protein F0562_015765 [Nyssa sinensis]
MARIKDSNATEIIQVQIQAIDSQEHSLPSTIPIKVQGSNTQIETRTGGLFFRKLFRNLFYLHIFLITILIIFLTIRGLLSAAHNHHFHPRKWYPPLLASTACAGIVVFAWQWITHCNPAKAFKAAFWLGPLLTCGVGILLISIGSAGSLAAGAVAIVSALIQSLYSCWVNPRFDHAIKVLSVSIAFPPAETIVLVILSILTGAFYSSFLVVGIGGATATRTSLDVLFILVVLLSLAWTMHVIKYTLQVTISRVKYMHFACGLDFDTRVAFLDAIKHSIGSIFIGSALVPVLSLIRGSARAMSLVSGDADEFMFSCANCYSGVSSRLVTYGNRWGFVHVGVYNKGFVQASSDTWEIFRSVGLEPLIESDLTSSFCFLSGVAGGAICTLVGGSWTLAVHKEYATEVSIYAFLIGYFMSRVAMAWPQACVSAYYVAYAENPQNLRFDSTIPDRIQELQRYRAELSRATNPTPS